MRHHLRNALMFTAPLSLLCSAGDDDFDVLAMFGGGGGSAPVVVAEEPLPPKPHHERIAHIVHPQYKGAGTHSDKVSDLREAREEGMDKKTHRAHEHSTKEERVLAKDLHELGKFTHEHAERHELVLKRVEEFRKRFPPAVSRIISKVVKQYIHPGIEGVIEMVKNDPLITKKKAEDIVRKLREPSFEGVKQAIQEWSSARASIGEHISAGGLPALGGGVLSYLNNSAGGSASPNLRLAVALSTLGAAMFGRGAASYTAAAIMPSIDYFGAFLNVRQGALHDAVSATVNHTGKVITLTTSAQPLLFTPSNAVLTWLKGFYAESTTATGVIVLLGRAVFTTTVPLTGVSTASVGTINGASTASVATDDFFLVQHYTVGTGTNKGRDLIQIDGLVT